MIVPIDRIGEFVKETCLQIRQGIIDLRTNGIVAEVPEGVQFSFNVVAGNGVNAIDRTQTQVGDPSSTQTTEPESTVTTTKEASDSKRTEQEAVIKKFSTEERPEITETKTDPRAEIKTTVSETLSSEHTGSSESHRQDVGTTQHGSNVATTTYEIE